MLCASAPLRRRADAHIVFAAHLFVVRPSPASTFPLPPMSSEYSPLRRFSRWLTRWRHRCGYGVHSPWPFRGSPRSLQRLRLLRLCAFAPPSALARRRPRSTRRRTHEKDDRLLFRLANAAEAREIALVGAVGPREKAYLAAASHRCSPHCLRRPPFAGGKLPCAARFPLLFLGRSPAHTALFADFGRKSSRRVPPHGGARHRSGCRRANRLDCFPKPPRSARQLRSRAVRIGLFCPATPATALRCGLFLS